MLLCLSRLLSYPTNLINASDTRRGIAKAFGMWSDVSPFTFREVPADQEADIKIGGYSAPSVPNRCSLAPGSKLLLCRYRFSLCAVIAEMCSPPSLLNHTAATILPSLYSARFIILNEKKNNFHTCQPMVKQSKLYFICPFGCKLQGPA